MPHPLLSRGVILSLPVEAKGLSDNLVQLPDDLLFVITP